MSSSFSKLVRCKALWYAVVAVLTYIIGILAIPRQPWLEIVRITQATLAMVAIVALSSELWRSLKRRAPDRVDSLTVSTGLKEFAFLWTGVWLLLWRLSGSSPSDRQDWLLDSALFGLLSGWVPSISSLLLITVPGVLRYDPATGEDVPPIRLVAAGIIAGVGLFCVLVILATKPNVRDVVASLRTWIP
jgi:hypothetical protein